MVLELSAEAAAAEGDDEVVSGDGPEHAGTFQPGAGFRGHHHAGLAPPRAETGSSTSGPGANGNARLCSEAAAGVSTTYDYNVLGRVTAGNQVTEGETYAFAYGYNLAGGLTRLTYPSGRVVSYGFDDAGRIEVAAPGMDLLSPDKYASQIQYHPHGAISQVLLGNGVVEGYGFNNRLQPTSITAVKGADTWLSLANYYCPNQQSGCASNNGHVVGRRIDDGSSTYTQSFEYDGENRVATAAIPEMEAIS